MASLNLTEFNRLNIFLLKERLDYREKKIQTKKGELIIGELYVKNPNKKNIKKAEIVTRLNQNSENGLVLKLETILPLNSHEKIQAFAVNLFQNRNSTFNYESKLIIKRGVEGQFFEDEGRFFFNDFKEHSRKIYSLLEELVYNSIPNSPIIKKIELAKKVKFPEDTPKILIYKLYK